MPEAVGRNKNIYFIQKTLTNWFLKHTQVKKKKKKNLLSLANQKGDEMWT